MANQGSSGNGRSLVERALEAQSKARVRKHALIYLQDQFGDMPGVPGQLKETIQKVLDGEFIDGSVVEKAFASFSEWHDSYDALNEVQRRLEGEHIQIDSVKDIPTALDQLLERISSGEEASEGEKPLEAEPASEGAFSLTRREERGIYAARDIFVKAADEVPSRSWHIRYDDAVEQLRKEKKPDQIAKLLLENFNPLFTAYRQSYAAFKGQRTILFQKFILNPVTYKHIKDQLKQDLVARIREENFGKISVADSVTKSHIEKADANWLYETAQLRHAGSEIVKEVIDAAGISVLKKARDPALKVACEAYDDKKGEGRLKPELLAAFSKLEPYIIDGEKLNRIALETVRYAAEYRFAVLEVNKVVNDLKINFTRIWDDCFEPFIKYGKREDAEGLVADIVKSHKSLEKKDKDSTDPSKTKWADKFKEIYDPDRIADQHAKEELREILYELSSNEEANHNPLYKRFAVLVLDNKEVRSKFFKMEHLVYREELDLSERVDLLEKELKELPLKIRKDEFTKVITTLRTGGYIKDPTEEEKEKIKGLYKNLLKGSDLEEFLDQYTDDERVNQEVDRRVAEKVVRENLENSIYFVTLRALFTRVKGLNEHIRELNEGAKEQKNQINGLTRGNDELQKELKKLQLEKEVAKLYYDAKMLRRENDYDAAIDVLAQAAERLKRTYETKGFRPAIYPLIYAELGGSLFAVSEKEVGDEKRKFELIERAKELSEHAICSADQMCAYGNFNFDRREQCMIEKAQAIANHNLYCLYGLHPKDNAEKSQKDKYKPLTDEEIDRLAISIHN